VAKKFPLHPPQPQRICWGCDKYCADTDLQCGNGSIRIQHPAEIDGAQWYLSGDWSNLLSPQQFADIAAERRALEQSQSSTKPHIVLRIKPVK
jgi:hypothetical protein